MPPLTLLRHCEERSDEAIHTFLSGEAMDCFASLRNDGEGDGLLRGACHRARIRASCWRAMTGEGVACRLSPSSVIARSAATKQSILSLRRDGLLRFARNDGRAQWIASRSLSSGAHSRDPVARDDGRGSSHAASHASDS
jgi:hypothetical protein